MRDPQAGSGAKDADGDPTPQIRSKGAKAPDPTPKAPADDPPSSRRGNAFVGTNVDAAAAYVPPTVVPETGEPTKTAPLKKVSLSADVDPRKVPTHPKMRQKLLDAASDSERPPPSVPIPDARESQPNRRGAGYAPSRSSQAPPPPVLTTPKPATAASRAPTKITRSPLKPEAAAAKETPAQRNAAVLLIFVFAALLAIAVYFFLRRAPSPNGTDLSPSAIPTAATATTSVELSVNATASAAPSASATITAPTPSELGPLADPPSASTVSATTGAPTATVSATTSAQAAPTAAESAPKPPASASATTSATASGSGPERWF